MKTTLAVAASLMTMLASGASAAPVRWQGEFMITGKSGTCEFNPTGEFGRVRFRPGIGGDNGSTSQFSVYGFRNANSYRLGTGLFDDNFKTVQTMSMGDGFGPVDNVVRVRFSFQKPDAITAATDFIDIRGQILGYDFMPLCTVNFKMTLARRID